MTPNITFYYHNQYQPDPALRILQSCAKQDEYHITHEYNEFLIDIYVLLDDPNTNVIAIDWDNTITTDITFFSHLIDCYLNYGLYPIICSYRDANSENIDEIRNKLQKEDIDIEIYCTDGQPKRRFLREQGITVHLWIDDLYPTICQSGLPLLKQNGIDYDNDE